MHDCWIAFPQNNLQCNFTPLFHKTLFSFSSFTINVIQSDQLRNFLDLILVEFYIKNKSELTKSKPINLKNYIAQIKLIFFEKQIKNNIHYGFINQFKLKKKKRNKTTTNITTYLSWCSKEQDLPSPNKKMRVKGFTAEEMVL